MFTDTFDTRFFHQCDPHQRSTKLFIRTTRYVNSINILHRSLFRKRERKVSLKLFLSFLWQICDRERKNSSIRSSIFLIKFVIVTSIPRFRNGLSHVSNSTFFVVFRQRMVLIVQPTGTSYYGSRCYKVMSHIHTNEFSHTSEFLA